MRVFHASRRKRWRGAVLVVAALVSAAYLTWFGPYINLSSPLEVGAIVLTWIIFFLVTAIGIERCFEPMPTLAATPQGLVLFPMHDLDSVVAWDDIRAIDLCRFGPKWWQSTFLDISVHDAVSISRHLPLHLKFAYRIDRWMAGDTSYYRPPADFQQPLAEVAQELEAWRLAYSRASAD